MWATSLRVTAVADPSIRRGGLVPCDKLRWFRQRAEGVRVGDQVAGLPDGLSHDGSHGAVECCETTFSVWIEFQRLELVIPFRWQLAELFQADAAGQAAVYGGLDEGGREEGKRQRQVDVTYAAMLAARD